MSVEKICENIKGHFTIIDTDHSIVGYLFYDLDYSEGNLRSHSTKLELPGADVDEAIRKRARHYFDNGAYTHSELSGRNFFDQIQMPSGMALCRSPDFPEMKTAVEQAGRFSKEAIEIEAVYRESVARFQPLRVVIDNFQLPDDIKRFLQEADEPIVKAVIGKYL